MLLVRNSLADDIRASLSSEISAAVLSMPAIQNAAAVCTYMHVGSEVRTSGIINGLFEKGKRVLVPVTRKGSRHMIFSELLSLESSLTTGAMGIPEPKPEFLKPVPLESADVVLVPGVAWDPEGYRLGYGAGYYDRAINALQKRVPLVGLAYECQIVEGIPRSRFDRPVNLIVTEQRTIVTGSAL